MEDNIVDSYTGYTPIPSPLFSEGSRTSIAVSISENKDTFNIMGLMI